MSYASQSDMVLVVGGAARFLELTDFNGDGVIDADVVARAQAAADSWIDPFLRGGEYVLPLANPCQSLLRLAAEEAVFQIKKWRGTGALVPTDYDDREARERELKDYSTGARRADSVAAAPRRGPSAWVDTDIDSSPVSREGLKGGVW